MSGGKYFETYFMNRRIFADPANEISLYRFPVFFSCQAA